MMSKVEFEEFLKRKPDKGFEEEIDWEKRRDDWIKNLDLFYDKIKKYLKKYIDTGDVTFRTVKKSINEEQIGVYDVDKLIIRFKGNEVVFEPVGTILIAARGRVDMEGNAGDVRFVLVDKNSDGPRIKVKVTTSEDKVSKKNNKKPEAAVYVWKIATPPPHVQFVELNEDSFFSSLMEVINA
jgi:hypothetical protein